MDSWRFTLFRFPVEVQPAFGILLGVYFLFSVQGGQPVWAFAIFAGVVFGSILLHELGHAAAARRLKVQVGIIVLHGFGGHVTHAQTDAKRSLLISLSGPGAGLALGIAVWLASPYLPTTPATDALVSDLLFVNIGWSLFNLLPMAPLDGGHALNAGLALLLTPRKAAWWSSGVGVVLGGLVFLLGLAYNAIFLLFIGGFVTYSNLQRFKLARR
jgi:stage IV sporulation protein FB